jgi:hypothetical protein
MRTSLFVSTLFAVSLLGGAALADKPTPVDKVRKHGDTFERYRVERTTPASTSSSAARSNPARPQQLGTPGASRINCSDASTDCGAKSATARQAWNKSSGKPVSLAESVRRGPNPLEGKVSERVNCNEGEQCSLSNIGAKSIWANHRARSGVGASDAASSKSQSVMSRKLHQAYEARMACNEGEECSFSSKDAKKIWRTEAFKAGTVDPKSKGDMGDPNAAAKDAATKQRYERE